MLPTTIVRSISSLLFFFLIVSTSFSESLYQETAPSLPDVSIANLPTFKELAKVLSPSVVNISVEGGAEKPTNPEDSQPGLPKEPTPKDQDPMSPFRSSGSGFLIHPDGFIITCNHVVDKSDSIIVRLLNDKKEYPATVIGKDKKTDIALLKIKADAPLPFAHLGNSDAVDVGEWAVAIGNQFELGQTVTAGIVSAKARRVPSRESGPYDQFIQTDASINPGSSGGPLFNIQGQVIGVNSAIFTPGRGVGFNIGIGFAVPINLVKDVVTQLKERGKVTRGMLGVIIQPIDKTMAEALHLPSPSGALVAEVMKDSPADHAGFKQRDIVTSFDGKQVDEYEDLPRMVAQSEIGKEVVVEVNRGVAQIKLKAKIEELKEPVAQSGKKQQKADVLGLKVDVVTDDIRVALKVQSNDGVVVMSVDPNSAAERGGLIPGDIILDINGAPIKNIDAYKSVIATLSKDKAILLLVQKHDGTRFIALKIKE